MQDGGDGLLGMWGGKGDGDEQVHQWQKAGMDAHEDQYMKRGNYCEVINNGMCRKLKSACYREGEIGAKKIGVKIGDVKKLAKIPPPIIDPPNN